MNTSLLLTPPDFLIITALLAAVSGGILLLLLSLQIRHFFRNQVGIMLLHYQPAKVRKIRPLTDATSLERAARSLEGALIDFRDRR